MARSAARRAQPTDESRTKMIRAVRAACRHQGIGDDDRRVIQEEVTGKSSMGEMDAAELGRLLDRLNKGRSGVMPHRAHVAKIRALWWTLYWIGAIEEPNDRALDAFVKRQTSVSALRFLDHRKAASVIEALKAWAAREGVRWPEAGAVPAPEADRRAVLDAIAARLRSSGALRAGWQEYCERALKLPCNHLSWSAQDLDACIRLLGKVLRRQISRRPG
jgi:hypothetical protein